MELIITLTPMSSPRLLSPSGPSVEPHLEFKSKCTSMRFPFTEVRTRDSLLLSPNYPILFWSDLSLSERKGLLSLSLSLSVCVCVSVCVFFRAAPEAYGSSQARGRIRTTAASLHHSHSNSGSKPCLWPIPQFMAMPDHLTYWVRPGIEPTSSWMLIRFVSTAPQWELQKSPSLKILKQTNKH